MNILSCHILPVYHNLKVIAIKLFQFRQPPPLPSSKKKHNFGLLIERPKNIYGVVFQIMYYICTTYGSNALKALWGMAA